MITAVEVAAPLAGLKTVERFGPASTDLGRVAVAFAGMLAARFGAEATCVRGGGDEGMNFWRPFAADGESALLRFLTASKRIVDGDFEADPDSFLLTDDPDLFASWPTDAKVLVRAAFDQEPGRPQSELTIMAASGLLDVLGSARDGRPQPLRGQPTAYAAGLAAFQALMASRLSQVGGKTQSGEVSCLDTALWLNWKARLANAGGKREIEEWAVKPCLDGFIAVIFRDPDIPQIAELTGHPELLETRFRTIGQRRQNLDEFYAIVGSALAGRTRDDIISEAERLKLPFAAVLSRNEVLSDPQMVDRRFFESGSAGLHPGIPVVWNGMRLGASQAIGQGME